MQGRHARGGEPVVRAPCAARASPAEDQAPELRRGGKKITEKDITIFTRQLAIMMKAGVPLLQAFDIVGNGHSNPSVGKLLLDIKTDVETGSSLGQAFRKYPLYFDTLFCNLVAAGEAAGILDSLLDRLATYKEKILAIKGKIKSALFYPIAIIVVAFVVTAVIMIFVIPVFKDLFKSFGADLPAPDAVRDDDVGLVRQVLVAHLRDIGGGLWFFFYTWKRSLKMQAAMDRMTLRLPIFGDDHPQGHHRALVPHACRRCSPPACRWWNRSTRSRALPATTSTRRHQEDPAGSLHRYQPHGVDAEQRSCFPSMVMQMVAIGEESGSLDAMLCKVADFFEQEVDDAVDALSSLMEPMIMVVLGALIGGSWWPCTCRSSRWARRSDHPVWPLARAGRSSACSWHGSALTPERNLAARRTRPSLASRQPMSTLEFLRASPGMLALVCLLLGLMVGSFLNVVVHRLPVMMRRDWRAQTAEILGEWAQEEDAPAAVKQAGSALKALEPPAPRYNLVVPRSGCPSCGRSIRAWENIPLLSYVVLRGRCAGCRKRISPRYPLVEAFTGLISAYIGWRFGFTAAALGALIFAWALIAASCIDLDTQLLPDDITLPLIWVGLLFNLWGTFTSLESAVIGAIAGYLSLWSVYWAFKLATGKEGMGYGDFKLLAAIGAFLGWKMLPAVILLSSLVGAVVGIALIVLARHGRHVPIPFGPYLAAAGLIALFFGEAINRAYLDYL